MDFLDSSFYGNTYHSILVALVIALAVLGALELAKKLAARHVSAMAEGRGGGVYALVVELLQKTRFSVLVVLSLFAGTLNLSFPRKTEFLLNAAALITFLVQTAVWGNAAITFWLENYRTRKLKEDAISVTMVAAMAFFVRVLLWALIVLIVLDYFGINITALVAGLGVGGIAVALAVQNILKDLFSSLSIVLDKPFVIGDAIAVDNFTGTIEDIGMKTTRVRSISGEKLIFPNSSLLESRIRNYRDQRERRVVFSIGVVYQTPPEKVKAIPGIIKEIIEKRENTRFERSHFNSFGDSSLGFETVYWVTVPDFTIHMDIQQEIYLALLDRFEQEGIEFAYPTRTLVFQKDTQWGCESQGPPPAKP